MAEFTSELKRPRRLVTLFITVEVAVTALIAVFLIVRFQKNHPPPIQSGGPVVVPGLTRPGQPEFEAYKDKIRIGNVKASIGLNFAGNRFAWIEGVIGNDGSRKLEAVELHIKLYDIYGKLSKEKTAFALRPGVGLHQGPMEPLENRTFTISIESVEQLWNPKRVEIEISGLKYQ